MLDTSAVNKEAVDLARGGPARRGSALRGQRTRRLGLVLAAAVSAAAWLPFLHTPLTSDESGFLLLGRHWAAGSSLYGDYWVDRPPLLMWLFTLAGHIGPTSYTDAGVTAPAVKVLGAASSGIAVLLTGLLARRVAPDSRWSRRGAVLLAVALLSSPLLGMPETDGEVLAVPFVLLGLLLLVTAQRRPWSRRVLVLTTGAGAVAMSAALVKQNVVDVFIFAFVLFVVTRGRGHHLGTRIVAFAGGGAAVLVAAVAGAWAQGTSPAGLWDAIVVFRFQASAVIGSSASEATPERMSRLVLCFVTSGAAVVLLVTLTHLLWDVVASRRASRPAAERVAAAAGGDLTWPALVLVAWELIAVGLGGSYWLHYLTGLVPGLVLLVALIRPARGRRSLLIGACLGYTAAASLAVWVHQIVEPVGVSAEAQVESYLRAQSALSDGVVVGFGHPDIVLGSGLASPYPNLWSLPVRVRDPHLEELQQVMAGPRAPRWIVVAGDSLDTWGLDAQGAQQYLDRHYAEQATYGDWHIWQRDQQRPERRNR